MSSEVQQQTRRDDGLLSPGDVLAGRFEIDQFLAEGGMGRVYVARQKPIGRKVALKVMKKDLVNDQASVKRFFREAIAVSKLQHPNTITIIDYGESEDKQVFIAMEFLDGESLDDLLKKEGRLSLKRAVNIVAQVARSLTEAHSKGVIHRDMKPDNVFVSTIDGGQDFVKVLDFGIAKLQENEGETKITRAGYVCGTPEYMSPEQARGEELDGRTDLYALGVMFWELLEGDVPYTAGTPLGIVLKHQTAPVPPLTAEVPESIQAFIHRAMSKDREERPVDAGVFLDELLAACPPNLNDYDEAPGSLVSAARRTRMPDTPPSPMRQTGADIAIADTQDVAVVGVDLEGAEVEVAPEALVEREDDPGATARIVAPPPKNKPIAGVLIGAIVVFLLIGAGVAAMGVFNGDAPKPPADAPKKPTPSAAKPVSPPPVKQTRVLVTGMPINAEIFDGETSLGSTPRTISKSPGTVLTLTIKAEGYLPSNVTATFPETGEAPLTYELKPVPPELVKVEVNTSPPGATLKRDGKTLGTSPIKLDVEADSEAFEVEVVLDGYKTKTIKVDPSMKDAPLALELEKVAKVARAKPVGGKKKDPGAKTTTQAPADTTKPKTTPKKTEGGGKKPGDSRYKLVH